MTPTSTLIRVELAKLIRRPMTWVLALILVTLVVLVYGSLIATIAGPTVENIDQDELRDTIVLPDGLNFGATLLQQIGTILVIILAAGSIGSEFTWGTFRSMLYMGASRARLLLAKLISLEILALATVALGIVLTILASLVSGLAVGDSGTGSDWLTASFAGNVLLAAVVTFVSLAVWTLIAATITLISHSLATGLGVSLAVSLLGGQVALVIGQLGTIGNWISRIIPNTAIGAIGALIGGDPPSYVFTDWLWITANLVGWVALFLVIAIATFRRMDVLATSS